MRIAIFIAAYFFIASNCLAAAIQIDGDQPPNTIKIQGVFTDVTDPTT